MQKKDVLNLIKYHYENKEFDFKEQAIRIAKDFEKNDDIELSQYIMGIISENNNFVPQLRQEYKNEENIQYFKKVEANNTPFPLPDSISEDLEGTLNAIQKDVGVNKFLLVGPPGTGKTESVKHIARLLDRKLMMLNISELIDSSLGKTSKNIKEMFNVMNRISSPKRYIFLIDEIDSIALDRINDNDLREMGRATSTLLTELDSLNPKLTLIATTNLESKMDSALKRRFDAIINFNRYKKSDLVKIGEILLDYYLKEFGISKKSEKTFCKILKNVDKLPYPGDLKNKIRTSLAFSDPNNNTEYLRRFMEQLCSKVPSIEKLHLDGFTIREIESLTGKSKSTISRILNQ